MIDMSAAEHVLKWSNFKGFAGGFFAFSAGLGSLLMTIAAFYAGQKFVAHFVLWGFAAAVIVLGLPWVPFVKLPGADPISGLVELPPRSMIPSVRILKSATFVLTNAVFFANVAVGWALVGNLATLIERTGASYQVSVWGTMVCLGAYTLGRLVFGPLSDFVGGQRKTMMLICMGVGLGGSLSLVVTQHLQPHWSVPAMVGMISVVLISYGGVKSLIGSWFVEVYGEENLGSVLGLHSIGYGLGAGAGPVLVAHTSNQTWSIVAVCIHVLGFVCLLLVRPWDHETIGPETKEILSAYLIANDDETAWEEDQVGSVPSSGEFMHN
jgi:nitrate/nitrite transporter NarK